jgi:hypothetical protein
VTPPLSPPTTANAVDREAAFLAASGDGLPALLVPLGGPFEVLQGYWPRTPNQNVTALYLRRTSIADERWANQRKKPRYGFHVRLEWRIGSTSTSVGIAETEQRAFDAAIELVVERVRGKLDDHTHGGYFLSVAEAPTPSHIDVQFTDPEQTLSQRLLRADMTYFADDFEVVI